MQRLLLSRSFILQIAVSLLLVLLLFMNKSHGSSIRFAKYSFSITNKVDALPPAIPPSSTQPQPFIPLLAPSPLIPFTNKSVPKLSGHCSLNFSAAQDIITTTATDCWTSFAPYLANVVCCPQFDAMLVTLIGQSSKYSGVLALNITRSNHCFSDVQKVLNIVLRWLASKVDPSTANSVFRGLSNCNLNKVCPLVFPNVTSVVKECGNLINNQTACCKAIKSYVSYLQEQSFLTNLQALKCATSLGKKLQEANVSKNIYNLCRISLKDFSLQESGCLLPSLPSNAVFDGTSGIGFICDLNDNIVAPWPTTSYSLPSSCNRTTKLPSLPTATSSQNGKNHTTVLLQTGFSGLIISSFQSNGSCLSINSLVLPLLFTSILLPKRLL
ncbi:hypothetical protein AAZX31_06G285300 [Glycine max]